MLKKELIAVLFLLPLGASGSSLDLENLLKMPNSFWQNGYQEFLRESSSRLSFNLFHYRGNFGEKLELFTELAGSYNLSVEEVKSLYERAVMLAVKDSLKNLSCQIEDPDIAFIFEDIPERVKLNCNQKLRKYIEERAPIYLKEASRKCNLLKLSPLIDSFTKDYRCSSLKEELVNDALNNLYFYLKDFQQKLFKGDIKTDKSPLKQILDALRANGLI